MYDIGVYCINTARTMMGDEPVEVSAMLARSADKRFDEVEETAAVLLRFSHTDQFGGEIEAFSSCILEDRTPEPSGQEGVAGLRIIEAIFASAERGRSIRLKPFIKTPRPGAEQAKQKRPAKKPAKVKVHAPDN